MASGECNSRAALCVFARLPVAGRVKTRLAATLASGPEGACDFYRACATHIISKVSGHRGASTSVYHSSGDKTEDVKEWMRSIDMGVLEVVPQSASPDLGVKMQKALEELLQKPGVNKALVVGTDIPDLSASIIDSAAEALDQYEVVIGPAVDGGYYLLGCREQVHAQLFEDIEWSTPNVLAATLSRAAAIGLSVAPLDTLPRLQDIDTAEDLRSWLLNAESDASTVRSLAEALLC